MAKKKTNTTKYKVIKPFRSVINSAEFNCKKGEYVELTPFEYSILSRFLEDI
jgi:hypothetical protein